MTCCKRSTKHRLLAMLVLVAMAPHARGAENRVLTHVPQGALFVLAADDLSLACEAFRGTSLGTQLCGAPFEPLVAALRQQDRASPLHPRPWAGLDWPDLAAVRAPAALAVFPVPAAQGAAAKGAGAKGAAAGSKSAVAWLFAADSRSETAARLRTSFTRYFEGKRWRLTRAARGAATLTTATPSAAGESPRVWLETADYCAAVSSASGAEAILAATAERSMAEDKILTGHWDAGEANESDFRLFVRPIPLAESIQANRGGPPAKKIDRLAQAKRLGMAGIESLGGRVHFAESGTEWQLDAAMTTTRPYQKALRALDLAAGPGRPLPGWVEEDASSVTAWRWDFATAMLAFGNLFDEMNIPGRDGEGMFDQMLDGLRDDPEGPLVDLRKDLFAKLGPEMLEVTRPLAAAAGAKTRDRGWVVETTCKAPADVVKLFVAYFKGDDAVKHEKIGGFDVWTVEDTGSLFIEGESSSVVTIRGVAVGAGTVMLATHRQLLVDTLNARGKGVAMPLSATEAWMAYADWQAKVDTPATALRSWSRPAGTWEGAYEQARAAKPAEEDDAAARMWHFLLFGTVDRSAALPYAKAPPFAAWSADLPPLGTSLAKTETGWKINSAAIK